MRKLILSLVCLTALVIGMTNIPSMEVKASESAPYDHSYLTQQSESTGKIILKTRGNFMQSGSTTIAKAGKGLLAAGGETIGQRRVDHIKVAVIVEQWNAVNQYWSQCHSWDASETNSVTVTTSRTLKVPRGYYYRVRGIHSANSDSGYSYTNGIWFG